MSQQKKRVAIIGAGASGLPTIRHALLYGLEPVCFERSSDIGGLWRYKPQETDESSVMKSTVINTSKEMTAYSDFPPPPEYANFMHNRKMLHYFELYAEHFDLTRYIKFQHSVTNVERSQSFDIDGSWIVHYVDHNNCTKSEKFDCVLLATGHHTEPFFPSPNWPGQAEYQGKITHAHSYKDHRGYEDKIICVVGVGNSGFDIAVELSRIATQVYVSTRRGTWIFNRLREYGIPYDIITFTRFMKFLRGTLPSGFVNSVTEAMLQTKFDHARYGLKPEHRALGAHPTVNDELPNRLACGSIIVKPNIESFTKNGLIFDDGSSIENVDEVIMSTGYSFGFPLAEGGKLIPVRDNHVNLYKLMYPIDTSKHNTLAVIGLIQPLGSIMPISELQSRFFFDVFVGHTQLPDKRGMEAEIRERREEMLNRYVHSRRHTIQVDYDVYMDELAELMGCKPQPEKYLFTDPKLALKLFFGGNMPYAYRLAGPHSWSGARSALMDSEDRILAGSRQRIVPPVNNLAHFLMFIGFFIFVIAFIVKVLF